MATEIQDLISLLTKTFEKGAWHGPCVKETLDKISPEESLSRLPDTHSIIELVAHMTSWKIYVSKKLRGDADYKVRDEMNFPQPTGWSGTVRALDESQQQLLDSLQSFPPRKLQEQVPWTEEPLTYYALVHGIIHHDLYHTGQIVLIKKAAHAQTI
jgi:uncharacterized damage-inducible protein DinB